jgi:hypothetical protein
MKATPKTRRNRLLLVQFYITPTQLTAVLALAKKWWPEKRPNEWASVVIANLVVHGLANVDQVLAQHTIYSDYCRAEGLMSVRAESDVADDRVRAAWARSKAMKRVKLKR